MNDINGNSNSNSDGGDVSGWKNEEYEEALRRVHEHPGHIETMEIRAFGTTLVEVFRPNAVELTRLLSAASTDPEVAFEMVQNVRKPAVRAAITSEINRTLHNYVASAMTLVEHSRKLMRARKGLIAEAYSRRKSEVLQSPEIGFIQDLRNLTLHRALPLLGHTLRVSQNRLEYSEIELGVADLLQSDRWSAPSRNFIAQHGEKLPLRPVVERHYNLVFDLNAWLINELTEANSAAVAEVNELIVAANAALMGVDLETARARMDRQDEEWPTTS